MTLTITISDDVAPTVVDNICAATDWTTESGVTKAKWARDEIITHIKRLNTAGAMRIARESQSATEAKIT